MLLLLPNPYESEIITCTVMLKSLIESYLNIENKYILHADNHNHVIKILYDIKTNKHNKLLTLSHKMSQTISRVITRATSCCTMYVSLSA